jgi:bifunctional oligoribonuclease and PAP phosphatase NrnA
MDEEVKKLEKLIEISDSILITSHISPDPDAVSSLLLMGMTLKKNYIDKQINIALEEKPLGLDFLEGYSDIHFMPLLEAMEKYQPDLFVLLDGNNYSRASRLDGERVRHLINKRGIKTAVIDHHELVGKDDVDVSINNDDAASVQTIYRALFSHMGLTMPPEAVQTTLVGFYADTGGFVYLKGGPQGNMFDFVEELVSKGANIEQVKNSLSQYNETDMRVLSELAGNVTHDHDYSYSFLSDEFVKRWLESGQTQAELQIGTGTFIDHYIRNIGGRQWGFIVYVNTLQGPDIYSVSFRAVNGVKDVAALANKLGGGGHKAAAGAKFEAGSIKEAIGKVKQTIAEA